MPPASRSKPSQLLASFSGLLILLLVGCGGGGGGAAGGDSPASAAVTLSWDTPVSTTDGSALPGLAGFHIYIATASRQYSTMIDAGNAKNYLLALPPGTYYFTITAYDDSGNESEYSEEVIKTVL
jgi:hypothetical protein